MIALAAAPVDWQGFLIVMGVLAYVVILTHFMDRHEHYRPTLQQLIDEAVPAAPEVDDDLEACTVCSGEGAVVLHFAADNEWESRECDFCSGTGVLGGVA